MKHFLDIEQLSCKEVMHLLQQAQYFKQQSFSPSSNILANYAQHTAVHLFYEHSTRTRISFELAARKLGISVVHFDLAESSMSKGETIEDTFHTLMAMGIDLFVVRHKEEHIPYRLSSFCQQAHVINAGDGQHAHPSQAMLDLMTILEHKNDLAQLKIAIVGDIKHSRVANSLQQLCKIMSVRELVFIAPKPWLPEKIHYGHTTSIIQEGLAHADVVICLRVQRERLTTEDAIDLDMYRRDFALTQAHLQLAKKNAIVLHPGPINRGIEIDVEVADGPQSCILQQVQNGVFMRMAIFDALLSKK